MCVCAHASTSQVMDVGGVGGNGSGGFHLILPSNSSSRYFPDNKISCYRTKLARPVTLRGPWEVALIQIQYPRSWLTFERSSFNIVEYDKKKQNVLDWEIKEGFYPSIESILDELNHLMGGPQDHFLKFVYDKTLCKVGVLSYATGAAVALTFKGKLARILGFDDGVALTLLKNLLKYAPHPTDISGGDYSLFVYSDVIQHQLVGDYYVPLLRCVQITGGPQEIVTTEFSRPHYVPVSKTEFDEITIDIKTDQNTSVPFRFGKVVAKLHFRPIKHTNNY